MGYKELITAQVEAVYQKGIANKILQFMQKIRNEYDEGQARRWAMELLQNGRDVAYPDSSLRAKFELQDNKLIYSHTGMPFRVKDILSIIYQVSSKLPGEESIGRFGTGFMSTYQLCEKVQLNGILKDAGEQYCPFEVMLDRTGTEAAEILEKIEESVEQIYRAQEILPEEEFRKEEYNTSFTYYLETSQNKQTAKIGMEDMKENVLYVLLFSEKVKEIMLVQQMEGIKSEVSYTRGEDKSLQENIRCLTILEKNHITGEAREHHMLYLTENQVTIAANMDENHAFLPISEKTPRLFIDFPLIGAEEFPFPVVVNSRRLQPNEPRSGIALSDNVNSKDSLQNKEVMGEAVRLYGKLFAYAIEEGLQRIEYIISIPAWKPNKEQSENWVKCNLYKHLYIKIAKIPFLMTNDGKRALSESCVSLIRGITTEEGKGVRELVLQLKGYRVPVDLVDWPKVLAGYETIEGKVIGLPELLNNAERFLKQFLEEKKMPALLWCQKLYSLAMQNEELALQIRSGQIRIYPNQDKNDWEQRILYTALEIKKDIGIPEVIKDVSEQLDLLNSIESTPLKVRKVLLHKEFQTQKEVLEFEKSILIEYIRRRSNRNFPVVSYSLYGSDYERAWKNAWELLLSCCEDEKLYQFYCKATKQKIRSYQKEETLPNDLFWNMKSNICKIILERIQQCKTLNVVKERLCPEEATDKMYEWMNQLLERMMYYMTETEVLEYQVLPNQEGTLVGKLVRTGDFYHSTWLKTDETKTEELKEILKVFSDEKPECNLYKVLLDSKIHLKTNSLMSIKDDDVAVRLNMVIQQLLKEHNMSDMKPEYQDACTRLLTYIQEEPEVARRNFPGFCSEEDQMRLLSTKAAARMCRNEKAMQRFMKELNAKTSEEAMEQLKQLQKLANEEEKAEGMALGEGWRRTRSGQPYYVDPYCDVCLDGSLEFDSEEERQKQIRFIGTRGEQYAFDIICKSFESWQAEEKTEHTMVFVNEEQGVRVMVNYPDTDCYKQSGWDIQIRFTGNIEKCYYVEVKTHTTKSVVRDLMALSEQQMIMAIQHRNRYAVMMVSYNNQLEQAVSHGMYYDPMELFVNGKIKGLEQHYVFSVGDTKSMESGTLFEEDGHWRGERYS